LGDIPPDEERQAFPPVFPKNRQETLDETDKLATIKANLNNQTASAEALFMARPPAKELTERELEVMHVFWTTGQATAAEIRDQLAATGRELAYTTVATLIRILSDKGFLEQTNSERPFLYRPARSFEDVSRNMVGDLIERVFRGSREQLVLRLLEERPLTAKERAILEAAVHRGTKHDKLPSGADQPSAQQQTRPPEQGAKKR
jgi:BlaI family transcriptional regulator, penicillinase repressor